LRYLKIAAMLEDGMELPMRFVLAALLVAGLAACSAPPRAPVAAPAAPSETIAATATPHPCGCAKGFNCGDCCGPDHCVCAPN
jgi:type IV pilus biogenesis protein CpaD/CtpE